MDKGLLLIEDIEAWQRSPITALVLTSLAEVLQTIREGYIGCDDKQFQTQKGRELQTLAFMDMIEKEPLQWLEPGVQTPASYTKGDMHEEVATEKDQAFTQKDGY